MQVFLEELRHAARQLARAPGFTLIALATISLAIGATTAVFSLVNSVLLRPLSFTRPDRLVFLSGTDARGSEMPISPQDMIDFRDQTHSFAGLAATDPQHSLTLVRPSNVPAVRLTAARVGASFFSLLGVDARLGRTFAAGEDARDAPKVVVLSDGAWKRYFGSDPRILGQGIKLNGELYDVVGVAPPRFTFPERPDVWYPAVWQDDEIGDANRGDHSIQAIARLRDGVTLASARRDLNAIASRIARAFPKNDGGIGVRAVPLRDQIIGNSEAPLWAMLGAVAFVLLIACANVANLLLVRATSRASEVAVRTALGAGLKELLRYFLAECMLLTVSGAALGTLMAVLAMRAVTTVKAIGLPRLDDIGVDGRVLALSAILALGIGLAFGLLSALQAPTWDLAHMLRSGTRGATAGRGRARSVLVLTELALGTVLLVGAGLLIRSFDRLTHVDPGFRPDHLVVFDVALSEKRYQYDAQVTAFADRVQAGLSALPGVHGVAVAATRPFDPDPAFAMSTSFRVDGATPPAPGTAPESRLVPVSADFFQTMGMSVARGRVFVEGENRLDAAPVVVINQALADRYFPGQNPIGKHLTYALSHNVSASPGDTVQARGEVIGVVRNAYFGSLHDTPGPASFFPYRTLPLGATFLVRTAIDPTVLEHDIRRVVAVVDPDVPTYELGTMNDALAESVAQSRFYTILLTAFAAVALLLATLGVYGVVSSTVSQRTRDFGIRIALGAQSRDVINHVLRSGASLIAPGLVAGVVGALLLTRAIQGLLFGVEPLDRATYVCVCLILAVVGTIASWLPARRAARVDPVVAMRSL